MKLKDIKGLLLTCEEDGNREIELDIEEIKETLIRKIIDRQGILSIEERARVLAQALIQADIIKVKEEK
ncbi:MAG TPA: hypothetical protein ENH06_01250 [bacterium]|nr:hypothetical protein [bacterium]HDL74996.1 hypothetical protein [bacterium]